MNWGIVAAHSILMRTGKFLVMDGWEAPNTAQVFKPGTSSFSQVNNAARPRPLLLRATYTRRRRILLVVGGHGVHGPLGLHDTSIFDPSTDHLVRRAEDGTIARWYAIVAKPRRRPARRDQRQHHRRRRGPTRRRSTTRDQHVDEASRRVDTPRCTRRSTRSATCCPTARSSRWPTSTGKAYLIDPAAQTWTRRRRHDAQRQRGHVPPGQDPLHRRRHARLDADQPGAQPRAARSTSPSPSPTWQPTQVDARGALRAHADGAARRQGPGHRRRRRHEPGARRRPASCCAEIWDPAPAPGRTVAAPTRRACTTRPRVLMPDGRVLVAGGGREGPSSPGEYSAEFYSPPYLFKGPRPSISSAPSTTTYGSTIERQRRPTPTSIRSVALVSLGADTHTLDMNQHFVPLSVHERTRARCRSTSRRRRTRPAGLLHAVHRQRQGRARGGAVHAGLPRQHAPTVRVTSPSAGAAVRRGEPRRRRRRRGRHPRRAVHGRRPGGRPARHDRARTPPRGTRRRSPTGRTRSGRGRRTSPGSSRGHDRVGEVATTAPVGRVGRRDTSI